MSILPPRHHQGRCPLFGADDPLAADGGWDVGLLAFLSADKTSATNSKTWTREPNNSTRRSENQSYSFGALRAFSRYWERPRTRASTQNTLAFQSGKIYVLLVSGYAVMERLVTGSWVEASNPNWIWVGFRSTHANGRNTKTVTSHHFYLWSNSCHGFDTKQYMYPAVFFSP